MRALTFPYDEALRNDLILYFHSGFDLAAKKYVDLIKNSDFFNQEQK